MKHFLSTIISLMASTPSQAYQYDVSIFSEGKVEVIEITVNKCVTRFVVNKDKMNILLDEPEAIKHMVYLSSQRAKNGCK